MRCLRVDPADLQRVDVREDFDQGVGGGAAGPAHFASTRTAGRARVAGVRVFLVGGDVALGERTGATQPATERTQRRGVAQRLREFTRRSQKDGGHSESLSTVDLSRVPRARAGNQSDDVHGPAVRGISRKYRVIFPDPAIARGTPPGTGHRHAQIPTFG